jgi:hypothetical protein
MEADTGNTTITSAVTEAPAARRSPNRRLVITFASGPHEEAVLRDCGGEASLYDRFLPRSGALTGVERTLALGADKQ